MALSHACLTQKIIKLVFRVKKLVLASNDLKGLMREFIFNAETNKTYG